MAHIHFQYTQMGRNKMALALGRSGKDKETSSVLVKMTVPNMTRQFLDILKLSLYICQLI